MLYWKPATTHTLAAAAAVGVSAIWFASERRGGAEPLPRGAEAPALEPVDAPKLPEDLLKRLDADEQINIRVYAAVNRSVVNITIAADNVGLFGDETSSGTGSGFLISKDGYVLTNNHVIEGADRIEVTLADGSAHEARIIGRDASNDVAVLRIDAPAEKLVPMSLGESSALLVGQKVLALGNPFGLERTLTTGIISSLDRSIKAKNGRVIKGIIQTDAAVNPGNSGGPLLNSRGEVIGMNTAIVSQVGQSAGISFAVPISAIKRILPSLIEHGRVIRADIGLTKVSRRGDGLLVLGLTDDGPAARAGIRALGVRTIRTPTGFYRRLDPSTADVVAAIDGKPVRSVDDLLNEVERHAPGEVVTVTVIRGGQRIDVRVTLGAS